MWKKYLVTFFPVTFFLVTVFPVTFCLVTFFPVTFFPTCLVTFYPVTSFSCDFFSAYHLCIVYKISHLLKEMQEN